MLLHQVKERGCGNDRLLSFLGMLNIDITVTVKATMEVKQK